MYCAGPALPTPTCRYRRNYRFARWEIRAKRSSVLKFSISSTIRISGFPLEPGLTTEHQSLLRRGKSQRRWETRAEFSLRSSCCSESEAYENSLVMVRNYWMVSRRLRLGLGAGWRHALQYKLRFMP